VQVVVLKAYPELQGGLTLTVFGMGFGWDTETYTEDFYTINSKTQPHQPSTPPL